MALPEFLSFMRIFSPTSGGSISSDSRHQALTRLKFIGKLQPGDKIDSKNIKVESPSLWTPIKRLFLTGDSRDTSLDFFRSTIERCLEIVAGKLSSSAVSDKIFCAHTLKDLIRAVTGLQNSQKTYADDNFTVCELEVLIQGVQARIFEIQKSFPDLLTMTDLCMVQIPGTEEPSADLSTLHVFADGKKQHVPAQAEMKPPVLARTARPVLNSTLEVIPEHYNEYDDEESISGGAPP
jgi:hypothetical protein